MWETENVHGETVNVDDAEKLTIQHWQEKSYLFTEMAITTRTRLMDFGVPQYIFPGASASCAPTPVGHTNR